MALGRGLTVLRGNDDGVLLFRRSFAEWVGRLVDRSSKRNSLAVGVPHDLPARGFAALHAGL